MVLGRSPLRHPVESVERAVVVTQLRIIRNRRREPFDHLALGIDTRAKLGEALREEFPFAVEENPRRGSLGSRPFHACCFRPSCVLLQVKTGLYSCCDIKAVKL